MKDKYRYKYENDVTFLTPDNREDQIRSLEHQRLEIVDEMEIIAAEFARLSGKRALKKRAGGPVGKAPNDYVPKK